ncbi:MAG TPA: WHG domain-containing protein [Solirubrobacteraceae bacterium]|nr:WHG domain-containing protein [Solirubrobacteraceae bacterium]
MPRAGLDAELVVRAAAELADAEGLDHLTLAALAQRLGVRSPSLYAHVGGLPDLRLRLAIDACDGLRDAVADAALGRTEGDALRAVLDAYREWARAHPGRYATIAHGFADHPEAIAAAQGVVEVLFAVMRSYGLEGEDSVHGVRAVRSAVHGFITLQERGGFQIPVDLEQSWERMVEMLDRGLRQDR